MKPQQLLPLGATTALASGLARGSISHNLNIGFCRQNPGALAYPPFPDSPICGNPDLSHHVQEDPHWTHASPCHRNGSIEFCVYNNLGFANNRGISVLTSPERAALLAKGLAMTDPEVTEGVNQDLEPDPDFRPVYRKEMIPGKGMGVVAEKFLQAGDHIMSSTASILIDYKMYRVVPEWEMHRLQGYGIDFLPWAHRERFMELSTDHVDNLSHLKMVDKILATNGFDVELGLDNDDDDNWYTVFPEISRFNHACRPNADYYFDPETLTQHVHAVRPIAKGEEITVSYIGPVNSRAARMEKLKRVWGFKCSCSHCTKTNLHAEESDSRLEQIDELRLEFNDLSTKSRATPQMAELLISLYEQEHLHILMYEAYSYAALEYNGIGEAFHAMKYARLAIEAGLSSVGPENSDMIAMENLLADPWAHWSWMSRVTRQKRWSKPRRRKTQEEEGDEEQEGEQAADGK